MSAKLKRRFRSATSGRWFADPHKALDIDAVKLGTHIIRRSADESRLGFIKRVPDWARAFHANHPAQ